MEMAQVGATKKGGCRRLALTDEDRRGRDAGCSISIDQIGDIFARRSGENPDAAAVVMGSHLVSFLCRRSSFSRSRLCSRRECY